MGSTKTNMSSTTFYALLVDAKDVGWGIRTIADGAKSTNSRSIHCARKRPRVVNAARTGTHWKTKISRLIINDPKLIPKPTPIHSRKCRLGESRK
jgi:hypothetical protein